MVNRDELMRGGLRAYEVGRLRVAMRATWVILPTVVLCAVETGAGETCACIGALLIGASIFLRWRDRSGIDSVREGFIAGTVPLMVGLAVTRLTPDCAAGPFHSWCAAVCLGTASLTGAWLALRTRRGAAQSAKVLTSGAVALLTASLGWAGLGLAAGAAAVVGLTAGAISVRALVRAPT